MVRVRAWLRANKARPRAQIAAEAGVDEKTLRLAEGEGWNPTISTLQKIEAVIPEGFDTAAPKAPRRRTAA